MELLVTISPTWPELGHSYPGKDLAVGQRGGQVVVEELIRADRAFPAGALRDYARTGHDEQRQKSQGHGSGIYPSPVEHNTARLARDPGVTWRALPLHAVQFPDEDLP